MTAHQGVWSIFDRPEYYGVTSVLALMFATAFELGLAPRGRGPPTWLLVAVGVASGIHALYYLREGITHEE